MDSIYDVIIAGGGPAGLTAGIYAVRRNLKTLIIEEVAPGGQMLLANEIENWPGEKLISGSELAKRFEEHARGLGVEILMDEIVRLETKYSKKIIKTRNKTFEAKALIIATGGSHRKLGIKGEEEFSGKGVSYCATCDGPFFAGKDVIVVGGGNAAVEDAIYLTSVAKKVFLIHRKDRLRAEDVRVDAFQGKNGEVILDSVVEGIVGSDFVEEVVIKDQKSGEVQKLSVGGVFISIGIVPISQMARDIGAETDDNGYIIVDNKQRTKIQGVFAAGDVTGGVLQITTAVGEGCKAGLSAYNYIEEPYWGK